MAQKRNPPTLTKPWRSATDLRASLTRARELGEQHARQLADLNGRVAQRRKELDPTLSDLPVQQRSQTVERAVGGLRPELLRGSRDSRTKSLRDLAAVRRDAADARTHYQSAVQMLARDGLGSERRSRLMQQIEHSGSAELASLAALAVSTKDRELAAALAARVQRVPSAERPFSPHELAEFVVGDEHRAIRAAIMEVEEIAERAMHEDRAFETGRNPAERGIGPALRARDRAELGVAAGALDQLAEQES